MNKIIKVGNVVGNGKCQGGSVFITDGICPTLIGGMWKGTTIPYVIVSEVCAVRYTDKELQKSSGTVGSTNER